MNPQTQSKGGWVASFIIVGAVLVLGLLAGLYYVKTSHIEGTPESAATESQEPLAWQDEKADSDDKSSDSNPEKPAKTEQDKPVNREKEPAEQKDKNQEEKTTEQPEIAKSDADTTPSDELPTTGPADIAAQFIGLVALTVAGTAYIQSRRGL